VVNQSLTWRKRFGDSASKRRRLVIGAGWATFGDFQETSSLRLSLPDAEIEIASAKESAASRYATSTPDAAMTIAKLQGMKLSSPHLLPASRQGTVGLPQTAIARFRLIIR